MTSQKMVRVASLPGDYIVAGQKYRASSKETTVPESLAISLGLKPLTETQDNTSNSAAGQQEQLQRERDQFLGETQLLKRQLDGLQARFIQVDISNGSITVVLPEGQTGPEFLQGFQKLITDHVEATRPREAQQPQPKLEPTSLETEQAQRAEGESETPPAPTPLPDGFPGKALLELAGLTNLEALRAADDQTILDIDKVGPSTLKQIREALG